MLKNSLDYFSLYHLWPFTIAELGKANAAHDEFQNALNVPAIQLVNQAGGFRKLSNGSQMILMAPACQWLAMLP